MLLSRNKSTDDPTYVGHKPCPKCGSKDNNYRYPDGHEFCFGRCGYYTKVQYTKDNVCALLQERENKPALHKDVEQIPEYPEDASFVTGKGLTWLKKYGIQDSEIKENSILWSQSQEQLIFPIYETPNSCDYIAWQARNFIPNKRKYLTNTTMLCILYIGSRH